MPSKIRPVMQWGGQFYCGGHVKSTLIYYLAKYALSPPVRGKKQPHWEWLFDMFQTWVKYNPNPPQGFFVFREKAGIDRTTSRYKTLCSYVGCGKAILGKRAKKQLSSLYNTGVEVARPREGRNAGAGIGEIAGLVNRTIRYEVVQAAATPAPPEQPRLGWEDPGIQPMPNFGDWLARNRNREDE